MQIQDDAMSSFEKENTNALKKAVAKITELKDELHRLRQANPREALAVIGMGCIFPGGANCPEIFWQKLVEGYDGICRVPEDRWDADAYFSKDTTAPGKINTKMGGFIDCNVANFDAYFFGISPKEATSMDPQQRLLLEVTWQALENAAINPQFLKETNTSVFIGSCLNDYQLVLNEQSKKELDAYMATGNSSSVMAGRIAYILGLQGPALSCDTACSSSLVAVHLACSALRRGETNLAIVGGVNLILSPNNSIIFSKANMLSEDGHCKPFDASADGYVRAEGCGVVIIKRLKDALRDRDIILSVIKGSAMNQDGASSGLTVPNISAQEQVIKLALNDASLDPADIDFIEAHGTGTALGDPIELKSINHVFKGRDSELIIGSVKANIGHLEGAAGIAGLIKTILSLQHQKIPRQCNFKTLNPLISLNEIKGVIPIKTKKWDRDPKRIRRAGISSFGFSGTNAHIIVEEAPVVNFLEHENRSRQLFCFSAKSQESLSGYLKKFTEFLNGRSLDTLNPEDVSYTLNTGRAQFKHRVAFFAHDLNELKHHIISKNSITIDKLLSSTLENELAKNFLLGKYVDFVPLYSNAHTKLQLPGYVFQRQSYWGKSSNQKLTTTLLDGIEFFDVLWQADKNITMLSLINKNILSLDNNLTGLKEIKKESLQNIDGIILFADKDMNDWESLFSLIQTLITSKKKLPLGFNVITKRALPLPFRSTRHIANQRNAFLTGLIKTLIWETPQLNARLIDMDTLTQRKQFNQQLPIHSSPLLAIHENKWYQPEVKNLTSAEIEKTVPFNPQGTHWITGGTGSLGLALASELIKLGVSSLILSSRSGKTSSVETWLKQNQTKDISIRVVQLDVIQKSAIKKLIAHQQKTDKPLKGIYHLAGANIQQSIANLNWSLVEDTLKAKMLGAKYLNELTRKIDLNYFVLYSSIASLVGSNRQLPYVIANSYLDSLALQRKNENRPCLVINWGPWSHSTMVNERMNGTGLIPKQAGLSCFTQLIQSKLSKAAVIHPEFIPFMFSFFPNPKAKWLGDFLPLIPNTELQSSETKSIEALLSLSAKDRKKKLMAMISDAVQETLELQQKPSISEGFFDLGMDSLMAVDVGRKIQLSIGIQLKPTIAFDYPNIEAVVSYLDELITKKSSSENVNQITHRTHDSIAIIGMSCHFPGEANNLEKFWECLYEGKDCVSEASTLRVDISNHLKMGKDKSDKNFGTKGGFIKDIDLFDADFFNISPREAESLDPQQRLVLENAWKALEHANVLPDTLKGKRVGIFVGISQSEYASFVLNKVQNKSTYHATGNALNAAAGRLAFTLGTQGPAMAIDTACSSSLVALHEACNSLNQGECELAIVAGVNAIIDPYIFMALANAKMLSPDGACKTFDDSANGYVRGEGCGVLILKRSEYINDDEQILALIKGSTINHDGASSGLTVPNGVAQQKLIKQTLKNANLIPDDINYIETHGSGTSLGDPIEIGALYEVFSGRKTPLIIGTVKTNIGHLESASGIAGVIKTVLSLNKQWIPKHLHFNKLNPHIDLSAIPAAIPIKGIAYTKSAEKIRRAGISSFGFTGTNAHVILEEAPQKEDNETPILSSSDCLFVLSAKSNTSLKQLITNYIHYLEKTNESLVNICYTAAVGRSHFLYRIAIKASIISELIAKLAKIKPIATSPSEENEVLQEDDINIITDVYLAGGSIDWNFYYKTLGIALKKIHLPTYCFDKKSYWLESELEKPTQLAKIHPLLQNQSYSHRHKERLFTTNLSLSYPSFINDHTIFDLPVIAGATYVSMMVSYVLQVLESNRGIISHLEFLQPLIVDSNNPRILQLIVNEENPENSKFELISYKKKIPNSYISHAQGSVSDNNWHQSTPISINHLMQTLPHRYDGANHQKNVAKADLHLGPHFHWIDEIYYSEHELLARMRPPTIIEKTNYDLYPGFIDASFQSMMVWFDFDPDKLNLHIPIFIEKIYFINPNQSPHYVHIQRIGSTQNANIRYLDENGNEILSMENFSARAITKPTLLQILNIQYEQYAPIYYIDWHRTSENAFSFETTEENDTQLLVISPTYGSFSSLKRALKSYTVKIDKKVSMNLSVEHILFLYQDNNELIRSTPIYTLQQQIQPLLDKQLIKSIGIIINRSSAHSLVIGYCKTLRQECPDKTIYLIESDLTNDVDVLARVIKAQCLAKTDECYVAIRDGTCYVPRLLNQSAYEARKQFIPHPQGSKVLHCEKQLIDNLSWQENTLPNLGSNQVRVKVEMTSLNFRDVLKLMGTYPGDSNWHYFEHAGIVTETGSSVNEIRIGDKVLVLAEKTVCTIVQTDANKVYKIPTHIALKEACSIPGVFLTAYGCLYELANIKERDKVLIHAASGGVGLASIQLAKLRGATIFVTTSSSKKVYLKSIGIQYIYDSRKLGFANKILKDTNGEGVDIVLNSLTSEGFIEESLRTLRNKGTFIEIGKINIFDHEKMNKYRPDVHYHIYALDERMALSQEKTATQLDEIIQLHREGLCKPLPSTIFDIRQTVDAFHYLKSGRHIGKVLIKHSHPFAYAPTKTYIISGGLGGLGQMLVHHLVRKGVKYISIIGRRQETSLPKWFTELTSNQVNMTYYQCDISNEKKLSKIIEKINSSSQKLAGIFHLAGLLSDKTIANLSQEDFDISFKAKVFGSLALHNVSKHLALDCFVMFSSIASIFGAPGQANYAAANAFMDELATQRLKSGLPALSINWGPFAEAGMAKEYVTHYQANGLNPLNSVTSFNAMDLLLERPYAQAIIADFEWNKASNLTRDQKLLSLVHEHKKTTIIDLKTILQQTPPENREQVLTRELKKVVASVLYIENKHEIDEHKGFFELGFDSLISADLWSHLQSLLGENGQLSKTILFEKNSIFKLRQYLQDEIFSSLFQTQQSEQNLLLRLEALLED